MSAPAGALASSTRRENREVDDVGNDLRFEAVLRKYFLKEA